MIKFNTGDLVYGPSPHGYEYRAVYEVIEQTNPDRVVCRSFIHKSEFVYPVGDLQFIQETSGPSLVASDWRENEG